MTSFAITLYGQCQTRIIPTLKLRSLTRLKNIHAKICIHTSSTTQVYTENTVTDVVGLLQA